MLVDLKNDVSLLFNVSSDKVHGCSSCSGGCESGNNWSHY